MSAWTGQLDALQRLVLRNASLGGALPDLLAALSALTHLDLAANALNGTLPQAYSALSRLAHLGGWVCCGLIHRYASGHVVAQGVGELLWVPHQALRPAACRLGV